MVEGHATATNPSGKLGKPLRTFWTGTSLAKYSLNIWQHRPFFNMLICYSYSLPFSPAEARVVPAPVQVGKHPKITECPSKQICQLKYASKQLMLCCWRFSSHKHSKSAKKLPDPCLFSWHRFRFRLCLLTDQELIQGFLASFVKKHQDMVSKLNFSQSKWIPLEFSTFPVGACAVLSLHLQWMPAFEELLHCLGRRSLRCLLAARGVSSFGTGIQRWRGGWQRLIW